MHPRPCTTPYLSRRLRAAQGLHAQAPWRYGNCLQFSCSFTNVCGGCGAQANYTKRLVAVGCGGGFFSTTGTVGYIVLSAAGAGASILAPMTSLYVVIPVVFAACIGHRMKARQAVGVVLSILAAIAFGLSDLQGGDGGDARAETKTILVMMLVICTWGLSVCCWQQMGNQGGADEQFAAYGISVLATAITGVVGVAAVFRTFDPHFRTEHVIVICAGACMAVGQIVFMSLCSHMRDDAAVVAPLASMYIIWPVIVGVAVFGEGMSWLKGLATVATVVAVLLMTVKDFQVLRAEITGGVRSKTTAVRRRLSKRGNCVGPEPGGTDDDLPVKQSEQFLLGILGAGGSVVPVMAAPPEDWATTEVYTSPAA